MLGEIVSPEVDIFVLSALGCVMLIARPLYCVDFSAIWQDPEKSIFWAEGSSPKLPNATQGARANDDGRYGVKWWAQRVGCPRITLPA